MSDIKAHLEVPITKGEGQYATTIGFVDILLKIERIKEFSGLKCDRPEPRKLPWGSVNSTVLPEIEYAQLGGNTYKLLSMSGSKSTVARVPDGAPEEMDSWNLEYFIKALPPVPYKSSLNYHQWIVAEVKADPTTAGDVLRQIALYRQFLKRLGEGWIHDPAWVVATCYAIPKREAESYSAAGIKHIRLSSEKIRAWAHDRDAENYEAPEV